MRIKLARRYHENATERRRRLARERYAAKRALQAAEAVETAAAKGAVICPHCDWMFFVQNLDTLLLGPSLAERSRAAKRAEIAPQAPKSA